MTNTYSIKNSDSKAAFAQGMKNGVPIALAYFAVSFSLGIAALIVGFVTAWHGFDIFRVAFSCCGTVLLMEFFIR